VEKAKETFEPPGMAGIEGSEVSVGVKIRSLEVRRFGDVTVRHLEIFDEFQSTRVVNQDDRWRLSDNCREISVNACAEAEPQRSHEGDPAWRVRERDHAVLTVERVARMSGHPRVELLWVGAAQKHTKGCDVLRDVNEPRVGACVPRGAFLHLFDCWSDRDCNWIIGPEVGGQLADAKTGAITEERRTADYLHMLVAIAERAQEVPRLGAAYPNLGGPIENGMHEAADDPFELVRGCVQSSCQAGYVASDAHPDHRRGNLQALDRARERLESIREAWAEGVRQRYDEMVELGIHPIEVDLSNALAFAQIGVWNDLRIRRRQDAIDGSAEHHITDISRERAARNVVNGSGCAEGFERTSACAQ